MTELTIGSVVLSPSSSLEARVARLEAICGMAGTVAVSNGVMECVCAAYGVSPNQIKGASREECFVIPRHILCWILKQRGMSWSAIGRLLGRTHGAIFHACTSVEDRMSVEPNFAAHVKALKAECEKDQNNS